MKRTPWVNAQRASKLVHPPPKTLIPEQGLENEIEGEGPPTLKNSEYTEPKPQFGSSPNREFISFLAIAKDYNVKKISSRQIVALSFDLYTAGYIDQDQHLLLSFQAELQPNFDDTIGALINEHSAPDKQRDFISIWIERCSFEQNYPGPDHERAYRLKFILNILRALDKIAQIAQMWQKTISDDDEPSVPNFPSLSLKGMEY